MLEKTRPPGGILGVCPETTWTKPRRGAVFGGQICDHRSPFYSGPPEFAPCPKIWPLAFARLLTTLSLVVALAPDSVKLPVNCSRSLRHDTHTNGCSVVG